MWRRRRKRRAELPRQLALGLLEDALGRAEQAQRQAEESEAGQAVAARARSDAAEVGVVGFPAQRDSGPSDSPAQRDSGPSSFPAQRDSGSSGRHVWPFSRAHAKETSQKETGQNSSPRRR
jgi:hypothetical protein